MAGTITRKSHVLGKYMVVVLYSSSKGRLCGKGGEEANQSVVMCNPPPGMCVHVVW